MGGALHRLAGCSVPSILLTVSVVCGQDVTVQTSSDGVVLIEIRDPEPLSDEDRLALVDELWDQGEAERARGLLSELRAEEGAQIRGQVLYRTGLFELQAGRPHGAESAWREGAAAEQDAEGAGWSAYGLAWFEAGRGKAREALELLDRIVTSGVSDVELLAWSYFQLGRVHEQMLRDPTSAQVYFDKVMQLYPESVPGQRGCWQRVAP